MSMYSLAPVPRVVLTGRPNSIIRSTVSLVPQEAVAGNVLENHDEDLLLSPSPGKNHVHGLLNKREYRNLMFTVS